jgi:hypothetical protein
MMDERRSRVAELAHTATAKLFMSGGMSERAATTFVRRALKPGQEREE